MKLGMHKYQLPWVLLFWTVFIAPYGHSDMNLGKPATVEEIKGWDIDVRPDGLGLPEGHGSVTVGEGLYEAKCAACHGVFGEGEGRWPVLAGGKGTLGHQLERPEKTIGSYWPFVSTIWDYVNRAMPYPQPQSLTADETYAIVAYLLYLNEVVEEDFVLRKSNFNEVSLENEGGFIKAQFPDTFNEPCMNNCANANDLKVIDSVRGVTPMAHLQGEQSNRSDNTMKATDKPIHADLTRGKMLYNANCSACHQANGSGLGEVFPALKGNAVVLAADVKPLITTIVKGRVGTAMSAFSHLPSEDLKAIIDYIQLSWGNSPQGKKVTIQQIEGQKAK